jgi:preprotein translocase subunit SecF
LLTYLLAAIAAVTVLVQVPLLLDGGGWLEYAALASTIGVLALIMATLFIRLRGGVFRRRPKL